MPIFLDRHDFQGMTAADVAEAHRKDLAIQDAYGVRFLTYWFDQARGTGFCLIDAPDVETAMRVHHDSHGEVGTDVIPVDPSAVEAFLGRITDPKGARATDVLAEPAFRAVMFTDIVDSTEMTARLGDARAVEMVRAHDSLVRRALRDERGREVKHTGDGIMASFDSVDAAVRCACAIQKAFEAFNLASDEPLRVRIGIHAGEPVEDSNDLFGSTVHIAARICQATAAEGIAISATARDTLDGAFVLTELGPHTLKGIAEPLPLYEVAWR